MSEYFIEGMIHVQPAYVSAARPPNIVSLNLVRRDGANRGWPDQEAIVVIVQRRLIAVVVIAERRRVTFREEVLDVNVRNSDLLVAGIECIQSAVGVLLKQVKISGVVLNAIRVQVAENSQAGLFVGEDEAAEVAGELLDTGTDGN